MKSKIVWDANSTCGKDLADAVDWFTLPDAGTLSLGSGPEFVEFVTEESTTSGSL